MAEKESNFVVIETVQGQMNADIIKSHLESEGIPVLLTPHRYRMVPKMALTTKIFPFLVDWLHSAGP